MTFLKDPLAPVSFVACILRYVPTSILTDVETMDHSAQAEDGSAYL